MTDIFISYSRKDIAFARLLHEALKENGFETWIDWQDIPPSTDWLREVYTAIEQTDTFIFILSSSSTLSEVCKLEIEHARKNNKRLIPIVTNDVDPSSVHPVLAAINWIFSRTEDEFQPAIQSLITAIQTDYEWAKAHTRLQMRALEWERAGNDKSFLLRGADLNQAEDWIVVAAEKTPEPTLLQTRYLQTSRQEAVKRQRNLLLAVGAALLVTIVLGVMAVINGQRATRSAVSLSTQVVVAENAEATAEQEANFSSTQQAIAEEQERIAVEQRSIAEEQRSFAEEQQRIAEEQRNIAEAKQLAASALNLADIKLDLAQLLSIEGYQKDANYLTRGSLLTTLQEDPTLLRHFHGQTWISSIVYDPEGAFFVSAGEDGTIRFWDPLTGMQIGEPLLGHTGWVTNLAISPDGTLLASSSLDGTLKLWDIGDRTQIATLLTTEKDVHPSDIAFSADGSLLAGVTNQGYVWVWDVKTLTPKSEPIKIKTIWNKMLLSPDGKTIITNHYGQGIKFWNVETGKQIGDPILDNIILIDLSPDGKILVAADTEKHIYFWDLENNRLISKNLTRHENSNISDIIFHPSGGLLFSVNIDLIEYWDVQTGKSKGILKSLIGTSLSNEGNVLAVSPDGRLILCAGRAGIIRMWSLYKEIKNSHPFWGYTGYGAGLASSPDWKMLAVPGKNMEGGYVIHLWDTEQMTHIGEIGFENDPYAYPYYELVFHPEGYLIFFDGIQDEIRFYDPLKMEMIGEPIFSGEFVNSLALSPDGKTLAVATSTNISLWNPETRQAIGEPLLEEETFSKVVGTFLKNNIPSMDFSPDGQILASGSGDGLIRLWDVQSWQLLGAPLQGYSGNITFSQDGSLLASADSDGGIRLWDVKTREPIGVPLTGHINDVTRILFNPDDSILFSAGLDKTIRLWDVATQQPIGLPITGANARHFYAAYEGWNTFFGVNGHESYIYDLTLSPDGKRLVSKDGEGNIRVWDMDVNTWIERACLRAGRNLTQDEWNLYLPFEPYRKTCPLFP